jgi:beta-glucanase (GH16 family)
MTSPTQRASVRSIRRVLAGAALLGLAGFASVQAIEPTGNAAAAAESDACGTVVTKADGSNWACSFVDNFDGSSLDRSKWLVQQTKLTGFYSGWTCFVDTDKNLQVTGGALLLTARRESRRYNCTSPYGGFSSDYTGAGIITQPELAQTYGRFEVRAKFPNVGKAGVHGGFWMYPPKLTYGKWPLSGEIDVAEWWSSDPTLVMPTLHYQGEKVWVDNGYNCRVSTPTDYHVYTVEWLPTGFKFFIDGQMCWSRTPTPDAPQVAPQPFDHPFSMILSFGVGPESGTNAVTRKTPLPATFTVDYAKSWR